MKQEDELLNEMSLKPLIDAVFKAIGKSLPKGKDFNRMTNAEKAKWFDAHDWDGKNWVPKTLAGQVKYAMTTGAKGITVGMTQPDKLVPAMNKKNSGYLMKGAKLLTRGAILIAPDGMALDALLGMYFAAKNPKSVEKNYDASKKMILDKVKKLIPKSK